MPGHVKVEDFEVFRLFRAALLKFAQAAERALSSADSEISSTHSWLENEQATYWQSQLRKRHEAVMMAHEEVRKKKMYKDFSGHVRDASQEEKALAKCKRAFEQAQEKIEAVKKALPRLEKESELYRGGVSRLNGTLSVEVPRAVLLVDRLAARLEEYVQIENPAGDGVEIAALADSAAGGGAGPSPFDQSMSRGGDRDPDATAKTDPTAASVAPPDPPAESAAAVQMAAAQMAAARRAAARKEGSDGADGK